MLDIRIFLLANIGIGIGPKNPISVGPYYLQYVKYMQCFPKDWDIAVGRLGAQRIFEKSQLLSANGSWSTNYILHSDE